MFWISSFDSVIWELVFGVRQKMSSCHSGPWTHPQNLRLDVTQCDEVFQGGIDPTVQRDIGRRHVVWIADLLSGFFFENIAPTRAAEAGIVMSAVHLAAKVPAHQAADHSVRWEVLLRGHPGYSHSGGQTVGGHLTEPAGVFVCPDAGHGPGDGGVLGRK